jgi:hypothetical protein
MTAKPPGFPDYQAWAPVKLLAFPEYYLQGNALKFGMDAAVIEIPGEETEVLSEIARKNGGVRFQMLYMLLGHNLVR